MKQEKTPQMVTIKTTQTGREQLRILAAKTGKKQYEVLEAALAMYAEANSL